MKILASNDLGSASRTAYVVQTNWPDTTYSEDKYNQFGWYYLSAYTTIHDPGQYKYFHRHDLYSKLFEREKMVSTDSLKFKKLSDAIAAAQALKDFGRLSAGWSGVESWHEVRRGPLKVRIVLETLTETRSLVWGEGT